MDKKIEELIKLHDEIKLDQHKNFVKDKVCICCKTNIVKPLYEAEEITINPLEQERGPWTDGLVSLVSAGFGSRHDLESYYIAICDPCLTKLRNEKIIEPYKELSKAISGTEKNYITKRVSDFRKNL